MSITKNQRAKETFKIKANCVLEWENASVKTELRIRLGLQSVSLIHQTRLLRGFGKLVPGNSFVQRKEWEAPGEEGQCKNERPHSLTLAFLSTVCCLSSHLPAIPRRASTILPWWSAAAQLSHSRKLNAEWRNSSDRITYIYCQHWNCWSYL